MGKIVLTDSKTTKKKNLLLTHTYEDITLNLPGKEGELVSDNNIARHIQKVEISNDVNKILKPDITENNGGITNEESWGRAVRIASYKTSMFFVGKHTATEWEAYGDKDMKSPLDKSSNPEDKEAWWANVPEDGKHVFIRYRFRSGDIVSPWSDLLHYLTPSYGVRTIRLSINNDSLTPTITASKFTPFGEERVGKIEHRSTDWRIKDSAGLIVFESLVDINNLSSLTLKEGILKVNSEYTVEVAYNTNNGRVPVSRVSRLKWRTVDIYIVKPELSYSVDSGKHVITGTPFTLVNDPDIHRATSWKVTAVTEAQGRVVRYNVNRGVTNLTKLDITPYLLGTGIPHIIECTYHSTKYDSGKAILKVVPKKVNVVPTVFTFEELDTKYGKLKFSTFEILDKVDKVKGIVYRVVDNNYNIERENSIDHTNDGKYRVPLEIPIHFSKILKWLDGNNTYYSRNSSKDRSFTITAYIIGEKYNTEILKTIYKPTIEIVADPSIDALDLNNTRFYLKNYTPNIQWSKCLGITFSVYDKNTNTLIFTKKIDGDENVSYTSTLEDNLKYNVDYLLEVTLHTNIGKIVLAPKEFYVPLGFIASPEPTVEVTPVNDNILKLKLKRGSYNYTPLTRTGKANKTITFKILDNETNKVLDTITLTNPNPVDGVDDSNETWHTIEKTYRKETGITYNKHYNIEAVYTAVNGVTSPVTIRNFEIGNRPDVIIGTPELKVENYNDNNIRVTVTNQFAVSGLEDKSHKATSWVVKENNSVVWASVADETNLSVIEFGPGTSRDFMDITKTYTLEVQWVASDGTSGPIARTEIIGLSSDEVYIKKVFEGTETPNRLNIEYQIVTGQGVSDTVYYGGRYKEKFIKFGTGDRIQVLGRARLDTTPITDWQTVVNAVRTIRRRD
jgi:hypothetical protein|nr:MAG TPA: hypothetical protein [Caudoviricetes sp.]